MQPVVQVGVTPLTEDQMLAVVATVESFLEESRYEGPIRYTDMEAALRDPDTSWDDLGRQPTGLEVMAACCALERQGALQFDFIGGRMHVASIPCNRPA